MGKNVAREAGITKLPIAVMRLDYRLGESLRPEKVRKYAAMRRNEEPFPPVVVCLDGEAHWLKNGYRRVADAMAAGAEEIEARSHRELMPRWRTDVAEPPGDSV